jgi:hypothetical protein
MTMNDGNRNTLQFDYSPTARYSVGYAFEHWRKDDFNLHAVTLNILAKRWNNPDSQGNFYILSGIGVTEDSDGDLSPAGYTGIQADWEDRRVFVSYENHVMAGDNDAGQTFFMQSARVGFAPYVGEYGDLHTWLMLEIQHDPEDDDNVTATPLVRLFKGDTLGEFGISTSGDVLFNIMKTF